MPKLPLTVTSVVRRKSQLWTVTVAFADGTTGNYIIPTTMATIEAVTISALAYGQLLDADVTQSTYAHGTHRRYAPRT